MFDLSTIKLIGEELRDGKEYFYSWKTGKQSLTWSCCSFQSLGAVLSTSVPARSRRSFHEPVRPRARNALEPLLPKLLARRRYISVRIGFALFLDGDHATCINKLADTEKRMRESRCWQKMAIIE